MEDFFLIQSLIWHISALWSVQREENFVSLSLQNQIFTIIPLKLFFLITALQIPSAADDASGPGLVFGSWLEMGYGHLHRLDRLKLGRDGADFVADLITFDGHVFPLDAGWEWKRKHNLKVDHKVLRTESTVVLIGLHTMAEFMISWPFVREYEWWHKNLSFTHG